MTPNLHDKIMTALSNIKFEGQNIVERGMISGLNIGKNNNVFFVMEVDGVIGTKMEDLRLATHSGVKAIKGVGDVHIVLTQERKPSPSLSSSDPHGMAKNPRLELPIKTIIAVGSGKGGVGKSTVAFNLAVALASLGKSVGLLDADIYGPSVPRLSGLGGHKTQTNKDGKIVPLVAHGIKVMSMGFLVDEEKPMIWRGPMIQTAFYQMLRDVAWQNKNDDLDILIIDMPPGTGDVQLTLAQKVPVTGAVIVSTPQDLALIDARKALAMFEKTDVKILGIIENMSSYCCPKCGHQDPVFGQGGAEKEAGIRGVSFLGNIPLRLNIRENGDSGQPVSGDEFTQIAQKILKNLAQ